MTEAAPYAVARDTFCAAHQAWLDAAPPRVPCFCKCKEGWYAGTREIDGSMTGCQCSCHSRAIGRDAALVYWLLQEHPFFPRWVDEVGAAAAFREAGCPACYAGVEPMREIEEGGL